jgi:hypothetical protein
VDESMSFGREPTWAPFVDGLKKEFYPVGSYYDQYTRWMTLHTSSPLNIHFGKDMGIKQTMAK